MKFTVVIPARYASTRLPGKPLSLINDKPMIQHVFERAQESAASRVIVATDDKRIFEAVKKFGGEVCMTASNHASGTDRIHEVSQIYSMSPDEIVVNVQGDEPLIPPSVINQVAENLYHHEEAAAATLSEVINDEHDFENPNVVKVVRDVHNYALYFSRASIPFFRDSSPFAEYTKPQNHHTHDIVSSIALFPQRHIGIYAYRVNLLAQFVQWPMATLEVIECLEQLRILANGQKIHIDEAISEVPAGIDTPEDLARINNYIKQREASNDS